MLQLQMNFDTVHRRENNVLSQAHLEENAHLFNESCFTVLKALVDGFELTTDNAKALAGTRSLPRRIKDLRDGYGISITDEWVTVNGKRSHIKWHMTEQDKAEALKILFTKLKKAS